MNACDIDWGAIATAYAGTVAVIGAAVVGFRQASINKRQTEILDQQAALARDRWKKEMFDLRFAVYK